LIINVQNFCVFKEISPTNFPSFRHIVSKPVHRLVHGYSAFVQRPIKTKTINDLDSVSNLYRLIPTLFYSVCCVFISLCGWS